MSLAESLTIEWLRAEFGRMARASAAIGAKCGCELNRRGEWSPGLRLCDVHERMRSTWAALEAARAQLGRS
jgi:hypothetical protein